MENVPQQKQLISVIPGSFEMEGKEPHLIGIKCSKCGNELGERGRACSRSVQCRRIGDAGYERRGGCDYGGFLSGRRTVAGADSEGQKINQ